MNTTTLLPAIRSKVGDWNMYITTMSFDDVARLIHAPDEIHERQKLSDWIQREAIDSHADSIANYILTNEQRFLGSLIVGIYDGAPDWAPLRISFTENLLEVNEGQQEQIDGKLGMLKLSGEEKLFAIDGQHRVAGIKKMVSAAEGADIINDEIGAIFVAHDEASLEGKIRTRRLFTTVNKKAKRISTAAKIALDEDDGFAISTRKLIDEFWLFEDPREHVLYASDGAIPAGHETALTTVIGIYELVKSLYTGSGKKAFGDKRPNEETLNAHVSFCSEYLRCLIDKCDEYRRVFHDGEGVVSDYRTIENNHLLFRPIGQITFVRALAILIDKRGSNLEQAIDKLLGANMNLSSVDWHHILWDPIGDKMIMKNTSLAESQLLRLVGEPAKTEALERKLTEFIQQRNDN